MIKRLIEYLITERRIEYIQYENSLKSNNARDYINYSTLKAIRLKFQQILNKINLYVYDSILFFILNDFTNLYNNFLLNFFCFKFLMNNIIKLLITNNINLYFRL